MVTATRARADAMDQALQKLTEASHKLAEQMYQQAAPPTPGAEDSPAEPADEEEVIDAEYVDVDSEKD